MALALAALAWLAAVLLPRMTRMDISGRWFLESLIRNAVFAGVPLLLLFFKHRQPVLPTLVPGDRVVRDFGWGLEIALAVGALNVLSVQRALPLLAGMHDSPVPPVNTPYPWHYLGAYEISGMRKLVLFAFGWGVFPPIGEELFFRAFLFAALRRRMKAGYAILLSAVAFALIHYPPGVSPLHLTLTRIEPMVSTLILGTVTAIIYEYSGCILSSIMIHMGLNMSFVLFMAMHGELASSVPRAVLIAGALVFLFHFFVSSRYLFRRAL